MLQNLFFYTYVTKKRRLVLVKGKPYLKVCFTKEASALINIEDALYDHLTLKF